MNLWNIGFIDLWFYRICELFYFNSVIVFSLIDIVIVSCVLFYIVFLGYCIVDVRGMGRYFNGNGF